MARLRPGIPSVQVLPVSSQVGDPLSIHMLPILHAHLNLSHTRLFDAIAKEQTMRNW
jgi:hypothetical protein